MKKIIKYFIPLLIFFVGFKVNATGIVNLSCDNGTCEVLNRCDNSLYCSTTPYQANTIQFAFNNQNFDIDKTYHFNLYFNLQNNKNYGSPIVTDCTLILNGQLINATRNSYRTNYRCSNDGCFSNYGSFMSYTMPTSLIDSTSAIRCYLNASFPLDHIEYTYNITSDQGSMINAMNGNTQNIINNDNNNANSNNNNRDYNTNRDIENRTTLFNGLQQTLSTILQTMQDKLNDVKTGISNVINTVGGGIQGTINSMRIALDSVLSTLQGIGQSLSEDLDSIISGITTGFTNLGNKIGELIGLNEVCTIYYRVMGSVLYGDDGILYKKLDSSGDLIDATGWNTSAFIEIAPGSGNIYLSNTYDSPVDTYYCVYSSVNSNPIACSTFSYNTKQTILFNQRYTRFIRFSYRNDSAYSYILEGDCQKSGIVGLFNRFTEFIRNLFNPNVDNASSLGSSEFNNFTTTNVGLRGLLDTLVTFVQNIFSQSCSALVLPIPFVDDTVTLPCMSSIYTTYFPTFFSLYQLITTGLISYRVIINLFHKVHQLEDVNYDKVEVLDL